MRKRIVHIIDDEQDIQEMLSFIISNMGYVSKTYSSWDNLCENDIEENDIVLTDIFNVGKQKSVKAKVYTMSGDSDKNPDLEKPFNISKINYLINS